MIALGVLVSGSGTNLQAMIDAIDAGWLDAHIVLVVSSRSGVYGLERAQAAGIPTLAMDPADYADPEAADARIAAALVQAGAEYVAMAGYMRMVGEPILSAFPQRVLNIHPALLPAFPGAHGIADAYAYGVKVTGVTIHFADAAMDSGPVIAQRAIELREGESIEALEERIHEVEHELYPQVLQLIAEGRVSVEGRTVAIADEPRG